MDSSKAQRLLQAKKKLKKFQHEQSSTSSDVGPVSINQAEGLSGSSESLMAVPQQEGNLGGMVPNQSESVPGQPNGHLTDLLLENPTPSNFERGSSNLDLLQLNNENYQPGGATSVSLDFTNDISNQLFQQNNENYIPSGSAHSVSLDFMNDISGQSLQRIGNKSNSGHESVGASSWAGEPASQPHLQTITLSGITELKIEMATLKECVTQYRQEIVHLNELLQSEKRKGNSQELEKSNMAAMNQKLQGKIIQLTIENEKLSAVDAQLRQEIELLRGDNSVLSEKLKAKDSDVLDLQSKVTSLASELSVARVNIEQMKNASIVTEPPPDYDLLKSRCNAFENESNELKSRVLAFKNELEIANEEHQRYVQATTHKLGEMEQQLTSLSLENQRLMVKEASLEQELGKLKAEAVTQASDAKVLSEEVETLTAQLSMERNLEKDRALVQQRYADALQDNDQLAELLRKKDGDLESRDSQINHLNEQIANLQAETAQYSREKYESLVATLQSDRVATSRALAQNKQMKERLLELEERFVHVMNEKLVLTEELETLRRISSSPTYSTSLITDDHVQSAESVVSSSVLESSTSPLNDETENMEERPPSECSSPADKMYQDMICQLENRLKKALDDLTSVSEERSILQETVKELMRELQGKASRSKRLISLIDKRLSHFDKERLMLRNQIDELVVLLNAFIDGTRAETPNGDRLLHLLMSISDSALIKLDGAYVDDHFYRCAHCMGMPRVV